MCYPSQNAGVHDSVGHWFLSLNEEALAAPDAVQEPLFLCRDEGP